MRDFAKVSPQIWINETGKELKRLGLEAQVIAFYLSTGPHACMIGIYYLPIAFIAHETGISPECVVNTLRKLEEINYCTYDNGSEYVWVHDMAFDQICEKLKINDNRVKAISDAFYSLPNLSFLNKFFEKYAESFHIANPSQNSLQEGSSEPLRSKEKDNDKENDKEKNKNNEKIEPSKTDDYYSNNFENNKNDSNQQASISQIEVKEQAKRILEFFNEKVKEPYPFTERNLKLITAHLNDGYLEKVCFQVITRKHREWDDNEVMKKYFQLEIIFGKKFSKYVAELSLPEKKDHA